MSIYPGETEIHTFMLPFPVSFVRKVIITYKQDDYVTLELETTDIVEVDDDNCKASFHLTQQQSLRLDDCRSCKIQVNVITNSDDRIVSQPMDENSAEQYHRLVIS